MPDRGFIIQHPEAAVYLCREAMHMAAVGGQQISARFLFLSAHGPRT